MQLSSIAFNIIKTSITHSADSLCDINILFDNSNSIFDAYISNIENIITLPITTEYSDYIDYDLILSNNPVAFSSKIEDMSSLHIHSLIYFHNKCPNNFKKEDKFLLKRSIKNAYKIFPNKLLMSDWSFDNENKCYILEYGLQAKNDKSEKNISVVVLNTNNNPYVDVLYNHIRQVFKDAILLRGDQIHNYANILQRSVVCIESESIFNILTAISHRCSVVSTLNTLEEYGLYKIDSYNNILNIINILLKEYNTGLADDYANIVMNKYNNNKFIFNFMNIVNQIRQEPFIYAKSN